MVIGCKKVVLWILLLIEVIAANAVSREFLSEAGEFEVYTLKLRDATAKTLQHCSCDVETEQTSVQYPFSFGIRCDVFLRV